MSTSLLVLALACREPPPAAPPPLPDATLTATVAAPPVDPELAGLESFRAPIEHSLEATVVGAVGPELGPALAQVAKRALVWSMEPSTDLRKGDVVEVVYQVRAAEEPVVHALWFESQKLGKTLTAVLYTAEGERWGRLYDPDGAELERRLVGGPIAEYEQVTSLVKDGRGHKGVDFKAPVGTPVLTPFDGVVVRKNWSFGANGNSLDIERKNGQRILLLHLSEIERGIGVGTRVKAGQRVATSGNTGRSTAPHLHYQIEQGHRGKVLDPFKVHETRQLRLPEAEHPKLRARFEKLSTLRARST